MASTKGQQSTVFKPLRCRYFNVASLSWYDRFHVRGCWFTAKQNKKKPLGIVESREEVKKRRSVL